APTRDATTSLCENPPEDVVASLVDARPLVDIRSTTLLEVGSRTVIGDIEVISFPVSHDAVAPCGYLLTAGGCRVCVAIDSGEVRSAMLEGMQQEDLVVLESNHVRVLFLRCPYPYTLKMLFLILADTLSI